MAVSPRFGRILPMAGVVRVLAILGLFVLHFGGYVGATESALLRPASSHWSFATRVDDRVPFLAWTWPFYWAAYPFAGLGGAAVLLALPARRFRRAVTATAAMLTAGALLQAAFPAHAPVPHRWHPAMELIHWAPFEKGFATFPSMHVALAVWTAVLAQDAFGARWLRTAFAALAAFVSVSTVTLHEHVLLDLVGGIALAGVVTLWYRRGGALAGPKAAAG